MGRLQAPLFLKDQVVLVTGAGRGIGRALARSLAATGARTVLAARTGAEIEATAAEIRGAGGEAEAIPTDVTDEDAVRRLFQAIEERRGRLDVLINNAGIGLFGPASEFPAADLDRVLAVNVRGTFLCSREALRLMKHRRRGYIINMASTVAVRGYPNQSAYTASKHAVLGFTKSLAVEAQEHGVRVSAVLPGAVDTGIIGEARPDLERAVMLAPGDVAQVVLFLLSLPERAAVDEILIRRRSSRPFS
jgi:NAD(P)-dependent dehydrogenase (short-subunit alcohol dehydrogenase family)